MGRRCATTPDAALILMALATGHILERTDTGFDLRDVADESVAFSGPEPAVWGYLKAHCTAMTAKATSGYVGNDA